MIEEVHHRQTADLPSGFHCPSLSGGAEGGDVEGEVVEVAVIYTNLGGIRQEDEMVDGQVGGMVDGMAVDGMKVQVQVGEVHCSMKEEVGADAVGVGVVDGVETGARVAAGEKWGAADVGYLVDGANKNELRMSLSEVQAREVGDAQAENENVGVVGDETEDVFVDVTGDVGSAGSAGATDDCRKYEAEAGAPDVGDDVEADAEVDVEGDEGSYIRSQYWEAAGDTYIGRLKTLRLWDGGEIGVVGEWWLVVRGRFITRRARIRSTDGGRKIINKEGNKSLDER